MPIVAVNVVKVLFVLALYGFLFYVARAMHGHITGPPVSAVPVPAARSPQIAPDQTPPPASPSRLVVIVGESETEYRLDHTLVVGRGSGADVRLEDEYASDRHASFTTEGGQVWVEDLGSTNGTTIDGAPLLSKTRVTPDSAIIIGRTRLVIR